MAAAGALSLAVHAAVLLGSARSGSSASTAAPPAPVLLTRVIAAPESVLPSEAEPVPAPAQAPAPPVAVEPPPAEPPRVAAATPTVDRETASSRPPAPPPLPLPVQAPVADPVPVPEPVPKPVPVPTSAATAPPVTTADATPIAAPPAPSVTYQGSMGLDPPPRPLTDIEQLVPETAGSRGGTVVLRLFINEQGTVDKAEVVRSSPPGLFDASALEAASRARFSPGYLAGVPVRSQVTFEVTYRATGSGTEAGGRTY